MSRALAGVSIVAAALAGATTITHAAPSEARVTQVIRVVNLLPNESSPKPATINEVIHDDTAVRTGDNSKSELTFPDLTITRLGANSIYSFNRAGRSVDLGGGSILLRVPKESGGASVRGSAVSVAVTGTTFILESNRGGRSKVYLLEGSARVSLRKNASEARNVLGGQMLDVPAGATKLPMPVNFDVNDLMKKHPLIVGFPPLPSADLIAQTAGNPPSNQPAFPIQITGGPVFFPGLGAIGLHPPGRGQGGGTTTNPGQPGTPGKGGVTTTGAGQKRPPPTRKPPPSTPPPVR